jgi:hypothetical protein
LPHRTIVRYMCPFFTRCNIPCCRHATSLTIFTAFTP